MRNASVRLAECFMCCRCLTESSRTATETDCWWLELWSADSPALRNVRPDIQTNVGSVWRPAALWSPNNSCYRQSVGLGISSSVSSARNRITDIIPLDLLVQSKVLLSLFNDKRIHSLFNIHTKSEAPDSV